MEFFDHPVFYSVTPLSKKVIPHQVFSDYPIKKIKRKIVNKITFVSEITHYKGDNL